MTGCDLVQQEADYKFNLKFVEGFMSNLIHKIKICLMVVVCFSMLFFSSSGYAGQVTRVSTVKLECCKNYPKEPTMFAKKGHPDVTLSFTTEGIEIEGVGLVKKIFTDYRGMIPLNESMILRKYYPKAHMLAMCGSDRKMTRMWPADTTIHCKKGDSLAVMQLEPDCNRKGNQKGVFTLTETKDVKDNGMIASVPDLEIEVPWMEKKKFVSYKGGFK